MSYIKKFKKTLYKKFNNEFIKEKINFLLNIKNKNVDNFLLPLNKLYTEWEFYNTSVQVGLIKGDSDSNLDSEIASNFKIFEALSDISENYKLSKEDKKIYDFFMSFYATPVDSVKINNLEKEFTHNIKKSILEQPMFIAKNLLGDIDDVFLKLARENAIKLRTPKLTFFPSAEFGTNEILCGSKNQETREFVWNKINNVANSVNDEIVDEIIKERTLLAQKQGFKNYGDLVLSEMGIKKNGEDFIKDFEKFGKKIVNNYNRRIEALKRVAQIDNVLLKNADILFYNGQYEKSNNIKTNCFMPFTHSEAEKIVFDFFCDFHGLKVVEEGDYNGKKIKKINSLNNKDYGFIVCDFFGSSGVESFSFMMTLNTYSKMKNQTYKSPTSFVYLTTLNREDNQITQAEFETMFHEFGHAFHSIVIRDVSPDNSVNRMSQFVGEIPSLFMENFTKNPSMLNNFNINHKIPKIKENIIESFEQFFMGWLDFKIHIENKKNIKELELEFKEKFNIKEMHVSGNKIYSLDHFAFMGGKYFVYSYSKNLADKLYKKWFGGVEFKEFKSLSKSFCDDFLKKGNKIDYFKFQEKFIQKINFFHQQNSLNGSISKLKLGN